MIFAIKLTEEQRQGLLADADLLEDRGSPSAELIRDALSNLISYEDPALIPFLAQIEITQKEGVTRSVVFDSRVDMFLPLKDGTKVIYHGSRIATQAK